MTTFDAVPTAVSTGPSWAVLRALARALDEETPTGAGHSERVAALARSMAVASGWSSQAAARLSEAALVHDVGRAGIVPAGARRPTSRPMGAAEVGEALVRGHLSAEQATWIRHKEERFNGTGGPDGLAGEQIPEGARLLSLADAWDTLLTRERPWGPPLRPAVALQQCRRRAGQRFCPGAVAALVAVVAGVAGCAPSSGTPTPPPLADGAAASEPMRPSVPAWEGEPAGAVPPPLALAG